MLHVIRKTAATFAVAAAMAVTVAGAGTPPDARVDTPAHRSEAVQTAPVAAFAPMVQVKTYEREPRKKDSGELTHRDDLFWTYHKRPGQAAYAKFSTWMHDANYEGANMGCANIWLLKKQYRWTDIRLYVWNNATGANFSMKGRVDCNKDTVDSFVKGMSHTPRMRFLGGEIRYRITGYDEFNRRMYENSWQVSGRLTR